MRTRRLATNVRTFVLVAVFGAGMFVAGGALQGAEPAVAEPAPIINPTCVRALELADTSMLSLSNGIEALTGKDRPAELDAAFLGLSDRLTAYQEHRDVCRGHH